MNNIIKLFYCNNVGDNLIENIINNNEDFIRYILEKNNNSIITLLLRYFIKKNDINNINNIINYKNIKLMKRDIFELILYFYIDNNKYDNYLFINKFKNYNININNFILETKDIDFILNNKLYNLLDYIINYYIISSISKNNIKNLNKYNFLLLNNYFIKLENININNILLNELLKKIEINIPEIELDKMNIILSNNKYDVILDGRNIIHSSKLILKLKNLKIIINLLKNYNFFNPLLIIHEKHLKKNNNLLFFLKSNNINYYNSIYKYNDDIFILWFFIKNNFKLNIISNDKFNDHIFELNKINYNKNKLNSFKYILQDKILNYNINKKYINKPCSFSKCIQLINNNYYVPTIDNDFIIINPCSEICNDFL